MSEDTARSRLGRGLAALIGEVGADLAPSKADANPRHAPVEWLRPNPRNPRRAFAEAELLELAASIRSNGLIQPIVVRQVGGETPFEIVAGERRWRAAQRAGLARVPIVLIEADDKTSLEFAIVENVQRADLNPVEEAAGYENLMAQFGYTQADLAASVGKSRSHIANTVRLLKLPDDVKARLADGTLSAGHGRALLSVRDPSAAAQEIVTRGLTVRDAEKLARREEPAPETKAAREPSDTTRNADIVALEKALESFLGLPVSIRHGVKGGELRIHYDNVEQLDALCKSLTS